MRCHWRSQPGLGPGVGVTGSVTNVSARRGGPGGSGVAGLCPLPSPPLPCAQAPHTGPRLASSQTGRERRPPISLLSPVPSARGLHTAQASLPLTPHTLTHTGIATVSGLTLIRPGPPMEASALAPVHPARRRPSDRKGKTLVAATAAPSLRPPETHRASAPTARHGHRDL